jgi:hypothetical protein
MGRFEVAQLKFPPKVSGRGSFRAPELLQQLDLLSR